MKKKIMAIILAVIIFVMGVCFMSILGGCRLAKETKENYMNSIYLTDYLESLEGDRLSAFEMEGKNRWVSSEGSIAVSAYYTTKIDGQDAFTYMITTAEALTHPHSVTFLDVSEDTFANGGAVEIEVTANFPVNTAIILPENLGVAHEVSNNTIKFSVNKYGSYTVIVNDYTNPDKAYTIFVREPEKVEVPDGYTLIEYEAGLHFADEITLKSNTVLYLHAGALIVAKPEGNNSAYIFANTVENVKIVGHGVIDMSQMLWSSKYGLRITNGKNIEVNGVTILNSPSWSMCFTYCENVTIKDCIIFGYRQNSDGYAICSSNNVLVKDCFARSGDDLFEVKTYNTPSKNVTFENCVAWPDNCRGFGIIQETVSDIENVTYKNCSLLYQLHDWSEHMSAFVITAGEKGNVKNIVFEDCELFYSKVFAIRLSIGENPETSGLKGFDNKITGVIFKNCNFKYPSSERGIIKFRNNTSDANGINGIVFENVKFNDEILSDLSQINPEYEGAAPTDVIIK